MDDLLPPEKRMCHRTGFAKKCRSLVTTGKCPRWATITEVMSSPTEKDQKMPRSNCLDDWAVIFQMDAGKMLQEQGAAIETFRNEMVSANERLLALQGRELREFMAGQVNGAPPLRTIEQPRFTPIEHKARE